MIFKFSNLGAIKETELDLRPLTIIIGPNNSNKTYLAYSLYGLLKELQRLDNFASFSPFETTKNILIVKNDKRLHDFLTKDRIEAEERLKKNLVNFFQDSSNNLFDKSSVTISIHNTEISAALKKLNNFTTYINEIEINVSFEEEALHLTRRNPMNSANGLTSFDTMQMALTLLVGMKHNLYPNPVVLPAERNALIITYKVLANRRFKLLRDKQQMRLFDAPTGVLYPNPVEDFLDLLTDIEINPRRTAISKPDKTFFSLANTIERYIQNKNRTIWKQTKIGWRELSVSVKSGLKIDLYNASSSIKQLAPLLLYLRYRARKNDLLIIDEPEMNLHPESQAKLLEALAILVNLGVKVLLTTHSPYFMAHLNNLVSGNQKNKSALKRQANALYLKDERAFLSMDDVSAYEMERDKNAFKLRDLKDEDYGIRWDTLSDVSADIQQKFFEIHEKEKPPRATQRKATKKATKKAKPKV